MFIFALLLVFSLFPIQAKGAECEIFYKIQVKRLHPDVRPSIHRFATVTDAVTKSGIGKIESIAFTPHVQESYATQNDCLVEAPHPFFYDALLTVRASGRKGENGYALGAFTLFRGAPVHFFTANFRGVGECTELYESEALS